MIIEFTVWTMLTSSIHLYALCINQPIYIEADQEKIHSISKEKDKL